ncbi:hypothetical protein [Nitrosomonas aestuarii]|uniref:hypothetical protein n=1 Tax=Nitrosomonas aestuarii TaxID=52441 RepID=UPI000D3275A4|nr:hypothetical protein [Nitrosomonas aestuarii]PTN12705.1 hypothetical protein C8R11_103274 [Nitrosomonas aestuarii]
MNKIKQVQVRLSDDEKKSFEMCAELAGIPLATWMRERLRMNSIAELEAAGLRAPFIDELVREFRNG